MKDTMTSRPNILWVSFEDTNPFYGCYGDDLARTPNVDRLASEGCVWPNCFSTAGVCAPARSAVITGMYPISIGTHHMRTSWHIPYSIDPPTPYSAVIPHYAKCFSEYFRAAGYYCTNNKKTDYQFDAPFTAWDECSDTAHWRNRPDPDQPFFAVFNHDSTHESFMWPEKGPEPNVDPERIELPPYFPDTPKVREAMARMYTSIEIADGVLGRILAELEGDGLAENTIIVHWSDHGPMPRGKRWPYDSGIHVPMIIRWPGVIEPGTRSERMVSTVDLAPTMLSCAGLDIPWHLQGLAFLGDAEAEPREYIFASRDRYDIDYDMIRAARDTRFKYIRNYRPELPYLLWVPYRNRHPILQEMYRLHLNGELNEAQSLMFRESRPVEELYDTEADPWEIHNLAEHPTYGAHLSRLRNALDNWLDEVGDLGRIPETEMVRAWYPNGERPQTAPAVPVPICASSPGIEEQKNLEGGSYPGPLKVQLYCSTQGASIGYRLDGQNADASWQLYSGPIPLAPGTHTLHTRAIRIGYLESEEKTVTLTVE